MAGSSLKIDDDYCKTMGQFFVQQGNNIESFLNEYIAILESINKTSIQKGEVAGALNSYIRYAKKIRGQINYISNNARNQVTTFLNRVDFADQYLF